MAKTVKLSKGSLLKSIDVGKIAIPGGVDRVSGVPDWVNSSLDWLWAKLKELGFDFKKVTTENYEHFLHDCIALVSAQPPSLKKFMALMALNFLHDWLHQDEVLKMLSHWSLA